MLSGMGKGKGERHTSGVCQTAGSVRQMLVQKCKRHGHTETSDEHSGRTMEHRFVDFIKIGSGDVERGDTNT